MKAPSPQPNSDGVVPDRYMTEVRATQLAETLHLVRYSALTPILVAATYLASFWSTPDRAFTFVLLLMVAVPGFGALATAEILGPRVISNRAVERGHGVAAAFACLIGAAWGTMPIFLFAHADEVHRLIIVGTVIGIVANVYVLGPILPVNLLFVVPVLLGGFVGLALTRSFELVPLMMLLCVYAGFIVSSTRLLHRLSLQRMIDRARVGEQSDMIGLLMRDNEESASDYLWELDRAGRLQRVSPRLSAAAARPVELLEGAPFAVLLTAPGGEAVPRKDVRTILSAVEARRPFHNQLVAIDRDDHTLEWQLTGKPIFDQLGTFTGYRGVASDVTAVRSAQARIAYLASNDAMTALANRESLQVQVERECLAASEDGKRRALIYIDLDGFKTVNDDFGHVCGDEVLREVGRRMTAAVPAGAMVGRLGGDEFAIICPSPARAQAEVIARKIIAAIGAPYEFRGSTISIGSSLGIAYTPDDATDANSLLTKADLALYQAKGAGKGVYRVFLDAYEQSLIARRQLEEDIKLALARQEFELHYQPLVDLASGRVSAFEALIRWTSASRGSVSPASFIPTAEAAGLITAIGRWALVQACKDAVKWDSDIHVAVNVSPPHFRAPDFVQDVFVALQMSGLSPTRLEIEITEGVFLDNSAAAVANLHALRRRGINVALDDFGTGYSSLNYLVNFPVDKIKIDRSFIRDFVERHENRAIVEAILALAKNLSIRVTAEGVETVEQAIALKLRRCDDIQGFLISKARPASEVEAIIRAVPTQIRELMPNLFSSPLAMALAIKQGRAEREQAAADV